MRLLIICVICFFSISCSHKESTLINKIEDIVGSKINNKIILFLTESDCESCVNQLNDYINQIESVNEEKVQGIYYSSSMNPKRFRFYSTIINSKIKWYAFDDLDIINEIYSLSKYQSGPLIIEIDNNQKMIINKL